MSHDLSALAAEVPRPGPVPQLRVGPPARALLGNGLDAMVLRRATVPRLELRLTVPAGSALGPSVAASQLLRSGLLLGSGELSQEEVSEAVQRLGGSLSVHLDQDRIQIAASALAEAEEELYRLICQVVTEPRLPQPELETERVKLIEGLRIARATPQFLAGEHLEQLLYPGHPYGRPAPSDRDIRQVSRERLLRLREACFLPASSQVTVVGDLEPRRTLARLEQAFAPWQGRRRPPRLPPLRTTGRPGTTFIGRPGSVQTVILSAASAPPLGHRDYIPLNLAAAVLGGSFSSRLMANLREDKGYTYSPHSRTESHLLDSLVQTSIEVRSEVTAPAQVEFLHELGRLATVEVGADELENCRSYLAGVRVITLQTQAGLAGSLAQLRVHGLDQRYLETYSRRLRAVSPAELRRVAARYLGPASQTMVLVGDRALAKELAQVTPLTLVRSSSRA
ncbi:MAG: M16 family metallopeptidase [Candidatus Dormibacteria bacterium]